MLDLSKNISAMQIKHIKPINFLYFRTRTRVGELGRFVGVIARDLYRDAAYQQLEVTGPVYWSYFGFTGDEQKEFVLEIGLPVAEIPAKYHGKFNLKHESDFYCVSLLHHGSWFDIPSRYSELNKYILNKGLTPSIHNREVYLNLDFVNPAGNITEIQIGIVSDGEEKRVRNPVMEMAGQVD